MEFNGEWFDDPNDIPVCGNCWDFGICGTTRGPDDSCGNFRNEEKGGVCDE